MTMSYIFSACKTLPITVKPAIIIPLTLNLIISTTMPMKVT